MGKSKRHSRSQPRPQEIPQGEGITLESGQFGWDYMVRADNGDDQLIQSDNDYCGLAMTFGWKPRSGRRCSHQHTDGSIDCPDCGKTSSQFIQEAQKYLDDHIGKRVEDPGYFQ